RKISSGLLVVRSSWRLCQICSARSRKCHSRGTSASSGLVMASIRMLLWHRQLRLLDRAGDCFQSTPEKRVQLGHEPEGVYHCAATEILKAAQRAQKWQAHWGIVSSLNFGLSREDLFDARSKCVA